MNTVQTAQTHEEKMTGAMELLFTIFEKIERAHADGLLVATIRNVYVETTNNDPMVMSFVDIAIKQVYS